MSSDSFFEISFDDGIENVVCSPIKVLIIRIRGTNRVKKCLNIFLWVTSQYFLGVQMIFAFDIRRFLFIVGYEFLVDDGVPKRLLHAYALRLGRRPQGHADDLDPAHGQSDYHHGYNKQRFI